jgi:hypothetical protein
MHGCHSERALLSRAAYTGSRARTGIVCTDESDNVDSILVVLALCEEDETATEGLLSINQWNNQQNEQSKNLYNRLIELRSGLYYLTLW